MSQAKTTRAFRTISEAGEELGLQPHVLRFWESKFSQIKPIKRGGGRRFYRPEDIEFIRGIKKLLHDEKHPIKDVQKLIQKKGANRIIELGRSVEKAAKDRPVAETDLLPKRIKSADRPAAPLSKPSVATPPRPAKVVSEPIIRQTVQPERPLAPPATPKTSDQDALRAALESLQGLKSRLAAFREDGKSS
ncbi:hypothetical protein GCM10011309_06630 [Litorimonas cladophorae]|uniref:HTH merR-type domain-containing protein n=1 Tax=Litorimonas cladophorae TaxID=1220491 RepID=A0A918KDT2_9PROT|nr:MerR family transcriptional regulator [Litorimonas cladophorae]GGX59544.1 hypothetical protein GCM10011309_06630 [Litorimonas cladophorae]